MALFKIFKGNSANLPGTYNDGYCYVTIDEHKMYIDSSNVAAGRFPLNAYQADQAVQLTSSAGSATQPVFFQNGKPVATTYTLAKSVPADAVFTDTNTWRGIQNNLTSTSTTDSLSAYQGKLLNDKITTTNTNLSSHTSNTSNPHSVTKAQVGLGNVDNTSDANKPVSTAQQAAINAVDAKFSNYLPLTAGEDNKLTGPLGLTASTNYGAILPTSGFTGQLFFVEDDGVALPTGGTAGQYLVKNSSTDGDASWQSLPSLNYLPLTGGTVTGATTFSNTTASTSTTTGAVKISGGLGVAGTVYGNKVYGAVWNDYAEYRICNEGYCAGRVVCENGDDSLSVASYRLQPGASIVSDTFGFAIGKTAEAQCPVAVSGRVLAFTYEDRNEFQPGEAVCAGPNGTVSHMTREEVREYPERIIGTVSAIPNYEYWGEEKVPVAGRIWIKVR